MNVDSIIVRYGLATTEQNKQRIQKILECACHYGLDPASLGVWTEEFLSLPVQDFWSKSPKAKMFCAAVLLWKRPIKEDEILTTVKSKQFAKTVENLRKIYHFKFRERGNAGSRAYYSFKGADGSLCREIIGFDQDRYERLNAVVRSSGSVTRNLSTETKRLLFGMFDNRCVFTNESDDLCVDHREPEWLRLEEGRPEYIPSNEDVRSGLALQYLQVVTQSMNLAKRDACHKCKEEDIILIKQPNAIRRMYKSKREGSCIGCFWHNPNMPNRAE